MSSRVIAAGAPLSGPIADGSGAEQGVPFLDVTPPHWAARGLAYVLILLFATLTLVAAVVHVPEVVSGSFTLVPVGGTDPIRALHKGRVSSVRALEGQTVRSGTPLFVIQSEPIGDRSADLHALETQLRGATERAANARSEYQDQRSAEEQEEIRLTARLANLTRTIELKRAQLATVRTLADNLARGVARGAVSGSESATPELQAQTIGVELEQLVGNAEDTRGAITKLRREMATRDVQYRELQRSISQTGEEARIRIASLTKNLVNSAGGELAVPAPCDGTVLRLRVNSAGAVLQEGDIMGEVACAGEQLQGELVVPQSGMALLRPGQGVKLLYDAFPYQRFGVKYGTVRWVGSAGVSGRDNTSFRALIDLRDTTVRVEGQQRALLAGMGGRAEVVVGRRALASYAFEPIRQLKESLSDLPKP
ncbi:MAG: HlyD family efflux transporter periplasmic adaptor subunit [Gemmatimonadaceae bacterium]